MCEYEITAPEEQADIEGILGNSDDPEGISTPWVKTKTLPLDDYFASPSLLWRTDVQCLALGILTMEWSPRSCLFDEIRGGFSRRLLCSAAQSLHALLDASYKLCETTISPSPARINLTGSIKTLLPECPSNHTSVFSRSLHRSLYDFEQVLNKDYKPDIDSMAIGILFITSKLFRMFVRRYIREEDSPGNILTLDPKSKSFTIIAHGPFMNLRFVLDFDAVFVATLLPTPVSFTLEKVLFAALQACVRSLVFKLSLDSADLMEFIGQMDDVVDICSDPGLPFSQRDRAESYHINATAESTNDRIPLDRAPGLRVRFNQNESPESSAYPTRVSTPRTIEEDSDSSAEVRHAEVRHADSFPRRIYADGVAYTREMSADRLSTAINADPVPSPETTRINESTKYSMDSRSEDQERDSLESGIYSPPTDAAMRATLTA